MSLDDTTIDYDKAAPYCCKTVTSQGNKNETETVYYNIYVEIIFNCLLSPIVGIFGSAGTIITIIVLYRHGYGDTTNIILTSLAGCDFMYLLLTAIIKMNCLITRLNPLLGKIYEAYMQVYIFNMSRYAMTVSEFHIVMIATERMLMVCFPFEVGRWITAPRCMCVLTCLYAFVFLLCWPFLFLRFKLVWAFDPQFNQTIPTVALPEFYLQNTSILDFYNSPVLAVLLYPGICAYLVLSSCVIAYKLRMHGQKRKKLTTGSHQQIDRKSTRMLLVLCIITSCLFIPALVMYMFSAFGDPNILSLTNIGFFLTIKDFFDLLYCATNFILYIIMSRKFYNTVRSLFSCPVRS